MGAGSGGFSGEWSCNCYDFMTGHICKHIYKVKMLTGTDATSHEDPVPFSGISEPEISLSDIPSGRKPKCILAVNVMFR